jgi:mRNA interferase YafQ
MPRALAETRQVRAGKKRIKRSGRHDWENMRQVVKESTNDRPLAKKYGDHEHSGDYAGVRECHVEPHWLLTCHKEGPLDTGTPELIRTGTHSELFRTSIRGRGVRARR